MPTHKLLRPDALLHARVSRVHAQVTMEALRQVFQRHGAWYVLCAYEMVVDGMYCVEAYVQCRSRWEASRTRDALDGRAIYDGCCFLAIELVPPIYTTFTTPDEFVPEYFYDDTPYAEWAAALAAAEHHDEVPASTDDLQLGPSMGAIGAPLSELASSTASTPSATTGDTVLELVVSDKALNVDDTDVAAPTPTTCSTGCPSCDTSEESALTSSAAPRSSMTVDNVTPELAAPVCGLDHNTNQEDPMVACPTPWSTPTLVSASSTSTLAVAAAAGAVCALFSINGSIIITQEQTEETGNPPLIRDALPKNLVLPWDPGDSKFRLLNIRILFHCVTNYEFLALPWKPGQQAVVGHQCLTSNDFTVVICARDILDNYLKEHLKGELSRWYSHPSRTEMIGYQEMVSATEQASAKDDKEHKMVEVTFSSGGKQETQLADVDLPTCPRYADCEGEKDHSPKTILADSQSLCEALHKDVAQTKEDHTDPQIEGNVVGMNGTNQDSAKTEAMQIDSVSKGSSSDLSADIQSTDSNQPAEQVGLENCASISASPKEHEKLKETSDEIGGGNSSRSRTDDGSHIMNLVGYSPSKDSDEDDSVQVADVGDVRNKETTLDGISAIARGAEPGDGPCTEPTCETAVHVQECGTEAASALMTKLVLRPAPWPSFIGDIRVHNKFKLAPILATNPYPPIYLGIPMVGGADPRPPLSPTYQCSRIQWELHWPLPPQGTFAKLSISQPHENVNYYPTSIVFWTPSSSNGNYLQLELGRFCLELVSVDEAWGYWKCEFGNGCASIEHSVGQLMEGLASLAITCELRHSIIVVENLLVAPYWVWCMRRVQLDMHFGELCSLWPHIHQFSDNGGLSSEVEVLLPRDTTQLQKWLPPPCTQCFVPANDTNSWFHSWLVLLLFGRVCSLQVWLGCHFAGTFSLSEFVRLNPGDDARYGGNVPGNFVSMLNYHANCSLLEQGYGVLYTILEGQNLPEHKSGKDRIVSILFSYAATTTLETRPYQLRELFQHREQGDIFSEFSLPPLFLLPLVLELPLWWDPGGGKNIESFMQAEAKGGRNNKSTAYYVDHFFYFELACDFDQVHVSHNCYSAGLFSFNLAQVHLNHGYFHDGSDQDYSRTRERQGPWDPGGNSLASAWGQAEFQGGRIVSDPCLGRSWAGTWAVGGGLAHCATSHYKSLEASVDRFIRMDHGTGGWLSPSWLPFFHLWLLS